MPRSARRVHVRQLSSFQHLSRILPQALQSLRFQKRTSFGREHPWASVVGELLTSAEVRQLEESRGHNQSAELHSVRSRCVHSGKARGAGM